MKSSFTEYKGLIIIIKESYYSQSYEFDGIEYQRYYEVCHAIDMWLENNK